MAPETALRERCIRQTAAACPNCIKERLARVGEVVEFPKGKVAPAAKRRTVSARCLFCRHEWQLAVSMVNTGLWVTQCPACEKFQPDVWHKEMFGR